MLFLLFYGKLEGVISANGVTLTCQYNPTDLTISKSTSYRLNRVPHKDTPKENFSGGNPFSTSLALLFDTTEAGSSVHTKYIEPLLNFMAIDSKTKKLPVCNITWGQLNFQWGKDNLTPFSKCVIKSANVTFTLFMPDGTPVRAKVDVTVEEAEDEVAFQNPTTRTEARKVWQVRGNETIDWIAYQEYGDSAHWRHIAQMNNLDDPRRLRAGQLLNLPPLSS